MLVRFRAGGAHEMAWHLFTWGEDVEVVEPVALREELVRWLEMGLGRHRQTGAAGPRRLRRARLKTSEAARK